MTSSMTSDKEEEQSRCDAKGEEADASVENDVAHHPTIQDQEEEDPEPLPLASNCWPQFILRAIFLVAMEAFLFTRALHWQGSLALLVGHTLVLIARNVRIRKHKAHRARKLQ
mmetsp:Transcript_9159/g.16527  ORF Transcript_9159/g.16527 Transcript_9159/m.16527 type:complete len:113 (-) Transcript_9159:16-354(-)